VHCIIENSLVLNPAQCASPAQPDSGNATRHLVFTFVHMRAQRGLAVVCAMVSCCGKAQRFYLLIWLHQKVSQIVYHNNVAVLLSIQVHEPCWLVREHIYLEEL
jgi:hypothetical protein